MTFLKLWDITKHAPVQFRIITLMTLKMIISPLKPGSKGLI